MLDARLSEYLIEAAKSGVFFSRTPIVKQIRDNIEGSFAKCEEITYESWRRFCHLLSTAAFSSEFLKYMAAYILDASNLFKQLLGCLSLRDLCFILQFQIFLHLGYII